MSDVNSRPAELTGQVALVTGAAHGQGRASALALAREEAHVVALDVARALEYPGYALGSSADLESLKDACRALEVECLTFAADVRDDAAVTAAVAAAIERFGRIDVLFNNAGICATAGPRADRGGLGHDARHQPQRRFHGGPAGDSAHDGQAHGGDHQQLIGRRPARNGAADALRGLEVGPGRADQVVGDRAGPARHPGRSRSIRQV